jgi:hypothetical protein
MRSMLFAILVCTIWCATVDVLAGDITVTNIATKVMSPADNNGDVWFAIKCTVRNNENTSQKALVTLQAVDADGFELNTIGLVVKLNAKESKNVSQKSYMPEKEFKKAKWGVKE